MPFDFNFNSSLLLASVLTGGLAAVGLLTRALWRRTPADALLALLIALPTLKVAERMLFYAGWANGHAGHARWLAYFSWYLGLALGPSYYLYFRSLTNQDFRWWPLLKHLLPGLLQIGLRLHLLRVGPLFGHALRWQLHRRHRRAGRCHGLRAA